MTNVIILVSAVVLLVCLLRLEKQAPSTRRAVLKGSVSLLFVAAALVQPHPIPTYYHRILAGLVLGLVGDVCLALPGNRAFRAGLFAFLAGHIFYVLAFADLTRLEDWVSPVQLIILAFSIGAFWWLKPHVGRMMVPVVFYMVVITLMLAGAWGVFRHPGLEATGRGFVWTGALCFYLSDLFVARQRFVMDQFLNRLVGLPLYYVGQFLLAFSVGLLR